MTYKYYLFLLLLLPPALWAQTQTVSGVVTDATTHENIPYVNVFVNHSAHGTAANNKGKFSLENVRKTDTLVFSALGYQTLTILAGKCPENIPLTQKVDELTEVVIGLPTLQHTLAIGSFTKKDITNELLSTTEPFVRSRLFTYDSSYATTPFLKSINIYTRSSKKATFNIRFYKTNPNGEPLKVAENNLITYTCKSGKRINTIDASHLGIRFPEEGLIVVIEPLITEENRFIAIYKDNTTHTKRKAIFHNPCFGEIINNANQNGTMWLYKRGVWFSHSNTNSTQVPAIAITLTD